MFTIIMEGCISRDNSSSSYRSHLNFYGQN